MENLKQLIGRNSKAIAGSIAGALVLWLAKQDIIIANELRDAVEVLLSALIVGVTVWFSPKNQE